MLLLLAACIDNGLTGPGEDSQPVPVDSGEVDSGEDVPNEVCNGLDDDEDGAIDEDFPDADANGRADCLDGECALASAAEGSCVALPSCPIVSPVADAWAVRELWHFESPASDPDALASTAQPLVVPLGTGGASVVVALYDAAGVGWLVAIDGATGQEQWAISPVSPLTQLAAADLDADGSIELLAWLDDGRLRAFDANGAIAWTSEAAAPDAEDGWHVVVADLDGDGTAEVVADTLILNGQSGELRATLAVDTDTHQHRPLTVGDLEGDGQQEVLVAGRVFGSDGVERWYSGEGVEDGVWHALVQLDADDAAEVITLGANLVLSDTDGTTLIRSPTFARNWSGGPCVGDFDGDGQPEFAYGAYDGFYVRDMDVRTVWTSPIDAPSGQAACVGYDLNADGALEAIYADESAFRIFDGRTGAANYEDAAGYESLATYASPAVADLDGDGDVEIVVVSSDASVGAPVRVYTHDGEGWPAVSSVWPEMDYDVWNIASDGSVPAVPAAPWLNGNGVRTAPVNPRYVEGADLAVVIDETCLWDCTYGPVQLSLHVENRGTVEAPAGLSLGVYTIEGEVRRLLSHATLGAIHAGGALAGLVIDVAPGDLGPAGLVVVLDAEQALLECDEANNEVGVLAGCAE